MTGVADPPALEVDHDTSGTFTVLRGYDQSHLLFRGRYTETYQNMTAADTARKVAQPALFEGDAKKLRQLTHRTIAAVTEGACKIQGGTWTVP